MNNFSEMTMANAENISTNGQDQMVENNELGYHNLDKKGEFQVGIHINEKLPISRETISSYKYRLQRLGMVRENIGRRDCHKVALDLISSQHMHLNQKKAERYVKVTKMESLSTYIVARACRLTVEQLERVWNNVATQKFGCQTAAVESQDARSFQTLTEPTKIEKESVKAVSLRSVEGRQNNKNNNDVDENQIEFNCPQYTEPDTINENNGAIRVSVRKTWEINRDTGIEKQDTDAIRVSLRKSWKIRKNKSEKQSIGTIRVSEKKIRKTRTARKFGAVMTNPLNGNLNVVRVNVITTWKNDREIKSASVDSTELTKIIIEKDFSEWDKLLEKCNWIRNLILGSLMTGDADADTRSVMNLSTMNPNFLDNEFLAIDAYDFMTFIGGIIMEARKPANTAATHADMIAVTKVIVKLLKDLLKNPKKKWVEISGQGLVFQMNEKPNQDLSISSAVEIILISVFATIKFYLTTKSPNWLELSNFPQGPKLKSAQKAIEQMGDSVNGNHFRLLLENSGGCSFQKRQEARSSCQRLLEKHFDVCRDITRNEGASTGWPDSTSAKLRPLIVELSTQGSACKVLDDIFNRKATTVSLQAIKRVKTIIEKTNAWGSKEGANTSVPTEFIDIIEKYLEKETDGSSSFQLSENVLEVNPYKIETKDLTGIEEDATDKWYGFGSNVAPVIIEDGKPIKWKPKAWSRTTGESLHDHIETEILSNARGQGVRQWSNLFRLIFYCLGNEEGMQSNFSRRYLSKMEPNHTMSRSEFTRLAKQLADEYDPEGITTWYEWRKRMECSMWTTQKKRESISAFCDRLMKATKKAYPENSESLIEKQMLCRKIFLGLHDRNLKQSLIARDPDFLMRVKEPEELIQKIQSHHYRCKKLEFWTTNEADADDDDEYYLGNMETGPSAQNASVDVEGSTTRRKDNIRLSRRDFIREVTKMRKEKSLNANVAENGDLIIRRDKLPFRVKESKNFDIRNYMPPNDFYFLTQRCVRKINERYGTKYDFYKVSLSEESETESEEEVSESDADSDNSSTDSENSNTDSSEEDKEETQKKSSNFAEAQNCEELNYYNLIGVISRLEPENNIIHEKSVDAPGIQLEAGGGTMVRLKGLLDSGAQISCITNCAVESVLEENPGMKIEPFDDSRGPICGIGGKDAKINVIGVVKIPKIKLADQTTIENVKFLVIPDFGIEVVLGFDVMTRIMKKYGPITMEFDKSIQEPRIIFSHDEEEVEILDGQKNEESLTASFL